MRILIAVLMVCFAFTVPKLGIAAETTTQSKHAGIEITVNINTADAEELAILLKGVGEKKAQQIVEFRDAHGQFKTVEELANVKGIGLATVEKNRSRIKL
ncbi:ComEA family DNA-binding protein [Vibrio tapetis subsp. quintayensis]|uniref:ComEA family DNA-binding protein n=1 Tax=Vibrio tapetis TaxID=52443 RepID=UPI0025B518E1|nr:ComEA family DNA-binding protein [Vibrio tapetis]MDN3682244.1 ComEA family DNA-binding protein [Vibrio tapetis subsp. quintayensis]